MNPGGEESSSDVCGQENKIGEEGAEAGRMHSFMADLV